MRIEFGQGLPGREAGDLAYQPFQSTFHTHGAALSKCSKVSINQTDTLKLNMIPPTFPGIVDLHIITECTYLHAFLEAYYVKPIHCHPIHFFYSHVR